MAKNTNTTATTAATDIVNNALDSAKKTLYTNLARAVSKTLAGDPTLSQRVLHAGLCNAAYTATTPDTAIANLTRGLAFGMNVIAIEDLMAIVNKEISTLSGDDKSTLANCPEFNVNPLYNTDSDIKYSTVTPQAGATATPEQTKLIDAANAVTLPATTGPIQLVVADEPDANLTNRGKLADKLNGNASGTEVSHAYNGKCAKCGATVKASKVVKFVGKDNDPKELEEFVNKKICKACHDKLVKIREAAIKAANAAAKEKAAEERVLTQLVDKEAALETAKEKLVIDTAAEEALVTTMATLDPAVATAMAGTYETLKACTLKSTDRVGNIEKEIAELKEKLA